MDLLLHLIKIKKIEILNVDILSLINQYLFYINKQKKIDIDISSEYLVVASYFLELKSRILIPKEKILLEDIDDIEDDDSENLRKRLLEYKKFKDISEYFQIKKQNNDKLISKEYSTIKIDNNKINYKIDLDLFSKIFQNILSKLEKNNLKTLNINKEKISLQPEEIEPIIIKKLLKIKNKKILFFDLVNKIGKTKEVLIAIFLSILNLAKDKKVFLSQNNENIFIEINI